MVKDVVNIRGKSYETVASRVHRFREADKEHKYSLITQLVERTDNDVVMKASILDDQGRLIATGFAEENRTSSQINRTSALENAETSAIGRCLAAFGMAGTEYASADEVANAIQQQNTPQAVSRPGIGSASGSADLAELARKAKIGADIEASHDLATPIQKRQILAMFRALHVPDEDMATVIREDYKLDPENMTREDAVKLLKELQ